MKIILYHLPVELPETQAPRGPLINIMPIGLLPLADRLAREGHQVEVVHAGVEARLNPDFDLLTDVETSQAELVGIALHWHPQIGPVGRALERLYIRRPDLPVVLGGMTASAFAEPILEHWPEVRAVITGEGETPLAAMAQRLQTGRSDWTDLPNLVFRCADGSAERSASHYVASREDMDALEPCRLDLLRHAAHYNGQFARGPEGWAHPPVFYLTIGRGCTVDCAFCSGGRTGHRKLAGRKTVVFRSASRVLEDLHRLADQAIHRVAICFDPPGVSEPYYLDLFTAVARSKLSPELVFECYQPPSSSFVEAFAGAFSREGSRLSFSPTVEDEELRARLLGVRYGNEALENTLALCGRMGIPTTLYFALLPQESRRQMDASLAWQRRLVKQYGCRIVHSPLEMEPEAPWSRTSHRMGLTSVRRGFPAFVKRHHQEATYGVRYRHELGYDFPDVDARVVRVASALVDPWAHLAIALTSCGTGLVGRTLLTALNDLNVALPLLETDRVEPLTLLLSTQTPLEPWEGLDELAERLGPGVRRLLVDPRRMRHQLWKGDSVPPPPAAGDLKVLHFADALAVQRGLRLGLEGLQAGVVLAELCRFYPEPCPAARLSFLSLGRNGALRCCPSSPPLEGKALPRIADRLRQGMEELVRERGCSHCPVESLCSKCLFTGRLSPEQFCALRRLMGSASFRGASLLLGGTSQTGGANIAWDS